MAMSPTSRKLGLTRDQLALFLQDHEQIRQFEKLFATVDTIETVTLDEINITAGDAVASANDALAQIASAVQALNLLDHAPTPASTEQINNLQEQIAALQQTPPPKEFIAPRYGSFYDTTDQTAAVINTAYAMTFNTTDLSFGVTRGTPTSRIYVDRINIYNIQFSAQFINASGGGAHRVWVWLRKNGTDVPQSATVIRIQGNNTENVAAWNFLLQMNAGDYFELMWEVDDLNVQLHADTATAVHPDIPSIILTVTDNVSSLEV
jgi:hypothetical protein